MGHRLVELTHAPQETETLRHIIDDFNVLDQATTPQGARMLTRILMDQGKVEKFLDAVAHRFGPAWKGRIVLLPVEATFPAPDEHTDATPGPRPAGRVSRDVLVAQITENIRLRMPFFAMALLSAIVAGLGLLKDNVAIVIGGMVLAPLLSPNMGLALATTLGDVKLGRRAIAANAAGVATGLGAALVLGWVTNPDASSHEIASRTVVDNGDVLLALVCGVAGALAFTTALSANLIGVMVAVAMMPPLVVAGMMAGAGRWQEAGGAALLLAVNIIAVNLAAVATFLAQGILPRQFWKKASTRKAAIRAMVAWAILLAGLAVTMQVARGR